MLYNAFAAFSFYTLGILEDVLAYVDQGLSWVAAQATWLQLVIWLVVVIFILVGFFAFLKKFIKAFLVIAVIAGILYVLNLQGILDINDIISKITNLFGAFLV